MSNLPGFWRRWRNRRECELLADGMSAGLAEALAEEEAQTRLRAEVTVGREAAAMRGFVSFVRDSYGLRRRFNIYSDEVPPDSLSAAQAWAASPPGGAHH